MTTDIYKTLVTILQNTGEMSGPITPRTNIGGLTFFGYTDVAYDVQRETGVHLGEPFYNQHTTVRDFRHYIVRLQKSEHKR